MAEKELNKKWGRILEEWKQSNSPIFYIVHTDECYCSPEPVNILNKAEACIEIGEHCYVGVLDFKKEIKERFDCYEDVAGFIEDQFEKCTEDKIMDVCMYNSNWYNSDKNKKNALEQVKNYMPGEEDFERYSLFYKWKTSDRPIFYADNAGNCWASDDVNWMKDICIHDIKNGITFVEIHVINYDKEARLKFNDYDEICDEMGDAPITDEIIFAAKFYEDCDEDMTLMSREDAISFIEHYTL